MLCWRNTLGGPRVLGPGRLALRCGRPSSKSTPAHLCRRIASSVGCENPKCSELRFTRIKVEVTAGASCEIHVGQEVRRGAEGEEAAAATFAPRGQRCAENSVCVIVRGCDVLGY